MHAGKPPALGGKTWAVDASAGAAGTPQEIVQPLAEPAMQVEQGEGAESVAARVGTATRVEAATATGRLGGSLKSAAFDVYGQPRGLQPSLPAALTKVRRVTGAVSLQTGGGVPSEVIHSRTCLL